jgi:hypothetical protein
MVDKQYVLVKAKCRSCGEEFEYVGGVQSQGGEYESEYGHGGEIVPLGGDACPKCPSLKDPDILSTRNISEAEAKQRLKAVQG